ncbi:MAG: dioxygenase [Schleiferiaceae bacterium]|nr:dioxygenase [Schleiferiaceae bacterium]
MAVFHCAFKVKDLASTRDFYLNILGCEAGRSSDTWLDFNFFGNQLTAHVSDNIPALDFCGQVDGVRVPIPHFGCLLSVEVFESIQRKLENAGIAFVVKPQKRYEGEVGEQRTMFVLDFSGNPIEFKAFSNEDEVFSK